MSTTRTRKPATRKPAAKPEPEQDAATEPVAADAEPTTTEPTPTDAEPTTEPAAADADAEPTTEPEQDADAEQGDDAKPDAEPDHAAIVTDAYRAAMADADDAGTVPVAPLDKLTRAYLAMRPPSAARALIATLTGDDTDAALAAEPMDTARIAAARAITRHLADAKPERAAAKPARSPEQVTRDALGVLAGGLAVIVGAEPTHVATALGLTLADDAEPAEQVAAVTLADLLALATGSDAEPIDAERVGRVVKLATGKRGAGGGSGAARPSDAAPSGAVRAHLAYVLADAEPGAMLHADAAAAPSPIYPPDAVRRPSAGAIRNASDGLGPDVLGVGVVFAASTLAGKRATTLADDADRDAIRAAAEQYAADTWHATTTGEQDDADDATTGDDA